MLNTTELKITIINMFNNDGLSASEIEHKLILELQELNLDNIREIYNAVNDAQLYLTEKRFLNDGRHNADLSDLGLIDLTMAAINYRLSNKQLEILQNKYFPQDK